MLPVDRERTVTMNMNLVVLVSGILAVILAILAVDFAENAILGSLLVLVIFVLVAGAITTIAYQTKQRQQRLKVMAQYGNLAQDIVRRAQAAHLKPMSVRQRRIIGELIEIFAVMYGRITGERCWISVRQVYTDGTELFIHDVMHPSNFKGPGVTAELDDLEASPAFRAIWGRVRQAHHPYYVCSSLEKEWKGKAGTMGRTQEEATWAGFYKHLIGYFGIQYSFSYHSMAVLPIGGGSPKVSEGDPEPKITPWGYVSVLSETPRAFSDPAVRDLGRRCAAILADLVVEPTSDAASAATSAQDTLRPA